VKPVRRLYHCDTSRSITRREIFLGTHSSPCSRNASLVESFKVLYDFVVGGFLNLTNRAQSTIPRRRQVMPASQSLFTRRCGREIRTERHDAAPAEQYRSITDTSRRYLCWPRRTIPAAKPTANLRIRADSGLRVEYSDSESSKGGATGHPMGLVSSAGRCTAVLHHRIFATFGRPSI